MALKNRSLTSLAAKALVVAVVAGGGLLIGGVANADTTEGSQDTGTGSPIGGLLPGGTSGLGGLGGLVGPLLDPILGGQTGATGGLNPAKLVKPLLDPILGGVADSTGLDLRQVTGPILGGLGS